MGLAQALGQALGPIERGGGRGVAVHGAPQHHQPSQRIQLGAFVVVLGACLPQLDGPLERILGRLEGQPSDGDIAGRDERLRRAPSRTDGRRGQEVLGQDLGQVVVAWTARLDGIGDPQVMAGPAQR